jgi:hypothetical protein
MEHSANPGSTSERYSLVGIFSLQHLSITLKMAAILGPALLLPRAAGIGEVQPNYGLLRTLDLGGDSERITGSHLSVGGVVISTKAPPASFNWRKAPLGSLCVWRADLRSMS